MEVYKMLSLFELIDSLSEAELREIKTRCEVNLIKHEPEYRELVAELKAEQEKVK